MKYLKWVVIGVSLVASAYLGFKALGLLCVVKPSISEAEWFEGGVADKYTMYGVLSTLTAIPWLSGLIVFILKEKERTEQRLAELRGEIEQREVSEYEQVHLRR